MGVSAHDKDGNPANFGGGQTANISYADIYAAGTNLNMLVNNSYNQRYTTIRRQSGTSGSNAVVSGLCAMLAKRRGTSNLDTSSAINRLRTGAWTISDRKILDADYTVMWGQ
jgi:hypothetical protein